MNPYDSCVANKMVKGKQLTVVWHVDDLKVLHVNLQVVDSFIRQMDEEFGKEGELNITRGQVHDYLGMRMNFSVKGCYNIRGCSSYYTRCSSYYTRCTNQWWY